MELSRQTLIERYGGPAPRYTSFPTANHFSDLDPASAQEALRRSGPKFRVYVHIPWCRQLCWYCGCNTEIRRDHRVGDAHVDDVLAELELLRPDLPNNPSIEGLSLGGGTPNFLQPPALRKLIEGIESVFPSGERRYATELDPRTVTDEQLDTFHELGFRRFSLGVQTLDEAVQQAVNRVMPRERIGEIARHIRANGSETLNFDLMVGLPLQTLETLDKTIDTVLEIAPDRLAVFQYAHIPRLRPSQKLLERHGLPGPMARDDLMQRAVERLCAAGFVRIGFDHFARPEDPLAIALDEGRLGRDFQGFSTSDHLDLIALGPSAIGRLNDTFTQNLRDSKAWALSVRAGKLPVFRGWKLSDRDHRYARFIRALMCQSRARWGADGLERSEVESRLPALDRFIEDGLVQADEVGIEVLPNGFDFIRQIAAVFDPYLHDPDAHASVA